MQIYKNEQCGFEIDIPEEWSFRSEDIIHRLLGKDHSLVFICRPDEKFNIQVGLLSPEPSLAETENHFEKHTLERGYTSLDFGRILVEGQEHVWARYYMGGDAWTKKYMIVLNGIEYAMTATCFKQKSLLEMEKDWDAVVKSFRLSTHVQVDIYDTFTLKEGEKDEWHEARSIAGGPLYAEAYKAMESGQFFKARSLLEICLSEDNSNVLAHKELAVILKRQGDLSGALFQRQEVKRLSPLDMVNRHNLVGLFVALERKDEALIEANEIIEQFPVDPHFHKRLAEILNIHLPYPTDGTPISPDAMDRVYKAYIHFETGHKFFRTGKYEEALEQFEKGKRQSTELSGNFLGVSTTIMQMIEFNAVAEDQISTNLDRAEENINECIRISPTESDYLNLKNEIDKYRKKYQQ